MKVLVTGAGGFLGGRLAARLATAGHDVIAWCRDERPATLDFFAPAGGIVRVRGDVRDGALWQRLMVRYAPQALIHLAAESQVRRALANPRETWAANLLGTVEALEAARCASERPLALIVASTDKAYGPPERLPYDETHPLRGSAPYDASKAAADLCARSYAASYGLPVAITRSANIYGGGDLNPDRIIPETCRAILERRHVVLRSDGSPERDYLHVEDVCSAYELLLARLAAGQGIPGEVFNIGSGRGTAVRDVVQKVLDAAGPAAQGLAMTLAPALPRTEIDRQILDAGRLVAATGWQPRYDLAHGLEDTWAWYRDHQAAVLAALRTG
jgi:CDP-glucose 4,6-dehydratase